jgi:hypothetical protein
MKSRRKWRRQRMPRPPCPIDRAREAYCAKVKERGSMTRSGFRKDKFPVRSEVLRIIEGAAAHRAALRNGRISIFKHSFSRGAAQDSSPRREPWVRDLPMGQAAAQRKKRPDLLSSLPGLVHGSLNPTAGAVGYYRTLLRSVFTLRPSGTRILGHVPGHWTDGCGAGMRLECRIHPAGLSETKLLPDESGVPG